MSYSITETPKESRAIYVCMYECVYASIFCKLSPFIWDFFRLQCSHSELLPMEQRTSALVRRHFLASLLTSSSARYCLAPSNIHSYFYHIIINQVRSAHAISSCSLIFRFLLRFDFVPACLVVDVRRNTATKNPFISSSGRHRNSGAAINSVKRRIDLNTPVTNKNGRIEEGGEVDFDAVN